MGLVHLAIWMPLLPLAGSLVLMFSGKRLGNPVAGWLATATVTAAFVVSVLVAGGLASLGPAHRSVVQAVWTWMAAGGLRVVGGVLVDPLSVTMTLFVTGVSAVIHLYSIGYMREDPQFAKFFAYLNLFVFSMLTLVLADNLVLAFVGWEGVGACSYFLIAFWFDRDRAATAGKKAFIVNRVGDFGFLVATFLTFYSLGTVSFTGLAKAAPHMPKVTVTAIALLLLLAAVGKSAQLPLFTWLVDAMEGPTPVSALIHAATMVTAGVYLMVRVSPLLAASPAAAEVVAIVGLATAFVGATSAVAQDDIKRVLAYSTVSQLGYMLLGVGTGAYVAAIFLMLTHAFYKALLFLGAGSVIHGMHDEQDIKKMGGLRRLMPVTAVTFVVAWLAIGGVPPLSGFWSKGEVLAGAFAYSPVLWAFGVITAFLTAYYIGREVYLVFYGEPRYGEPRYGEPRHAEAGSGGHPATPHESPWLMLAPLVLLAVAAIFAGLIDLPFSARLAFLANWLHPVVAAAAASSPAAPSGSTQVALGVVDGLVAIAGVVTAAVIWSRSPSHPSLEPRGLRHGWYFDDLYSNQVYAASVAFANTCAEVVERRVVDGAVNGASRLVARAASAARRVQSGYVRSYALTIAAGMVLILAFALFRSGL
ncbi:MAG: NADH-quinone oxidoreductase subunit L [Acidimicrobiales bacterium]